MAKKQKSRTLRTDEQAPAVPIPAAEPDRELKVRDLMSRKVFAVKPEDTLATAYDLMDSCAVRHLPVVDLEGAVVGVLTMSDLLKSGGLSDEEFTREERMDFLTNTKVMEVMTTDPATISGEDSLTEAGQTLMEEKFGCLPVVEGDQLVGILTASDFIRHVIDPDAASVEHTAERNLYTGETAMGVDSSITASGLVGGIGGTEASETGEGTRATVAGNWQGSDEADSTGSDWEGDHQHSA